MTDHGARRQVDDQQLTTGFNERDTRIDGHQRQIVSERCNRRGFTRHCQLAQRDGDARGRDVNEAHFVHRAIGIDQQLAVFGRGRDLGHRRRCGVLVIQIVGQSGYTAEVAVRSALVDVMRPSAATTSIGLGVGRVERAHEYSCKNGS